jgi:cyclopropane-fatty-acyl-phospholipid synthase
MTKSSYPNATNRLSFDNPSTKIDLAGVPWFMKLILKPISKLTYGALDIQLPDGQMIHVKGTQPGPSATVVIKSYKFAWSIILNGHIGAGDAYLAGQWESPDIEAVLHLFAQNEAVFTGPMTGLWLPLFAQRLFHFFHRNNRAGAKRNIHHHYDLGNNFYKRWLDSTMTYSSAKFERTNDNLSSAQLNKYRSLASRIDLKKEHTLLEIGCGWGGFSEFVAREIGCQVVALTISHEQYEFAKKRMEKNGLSDKVDVRFQDYRDTNEKFDRIASIEMFEAVGEEYWPAYFSKIRETLKPGGLAGLQIITIDEGSYDAYRKSVDFIQRYIFPGGMLPSPSALREEIAKAGLTWNDNIEFGQDYAKTLAQWRNRFLDAWPEIRQLGFDERFRRMWEYYLAYSEAGFRSGNIDVTQLTVARI